MIKMVPLPTRNREPSAGRYPSICVSGYQAQDGASITIGRRPTILRHVNYCGVVVRIETRGGSRPDERGVIGAQLLRCKNVASRDTAASIRRDPLEMESRTKGLSVEIARLAISP